MADTRRSVADLLDILADNSIGDISAQDLRDVLVSTMGVFGSIYFSDASVPLSIGTTPTTVINFPSQGILQGVAANLTAGSMTISIAGQYKIDISSSFTATANIIAQLFCAINGTKSDLGFHRKVSSGGDVGAGSTAGSVTLSVGDVLTVVAESDSNSKTMTTVDLFFHIELIG